MRHETVCGAYLLVEWDALLSPAIGLEFNWKREVSSLELMMCVPTSFPPPNIQKRVLLKKNASFPLDISKIALLLQRFSGEKPRKKSMNVLSVL